MTDKQIKLIESLRDWRRPVLTDEDRAALTALLQEAFETRELLEAASFILVHVNGDEYAIEDTLAKWMYYKDGPTKIDPLGDIKSGFDSALDAYRDLKKGESK